MRELSVHPDALAAVAGLVSRGWGTEGYRFADFSTYGDGSVLAEVRCSDGSEFYVGSTRHGNTVHAQDDVECYRLLKDQLSEERNTLRDTGSAVAEMGLLVALLFMIVTLLTILFGQIAAQLGTVDLTGTVTVSCSQVDGLPCPASTR